MLSLFPMSLIMLSIMTDGDPAMSASDVRAGWTICNATFALFRLQTLSRWKQRSVRSRGWRGSSYVQLQHHIQQLSGDSHPVQRQEQQTQKQ